MVVGKAIYEGILLKANFAPFFLNRFSDHGNTVDDLRFLDPTLYQNLLYLKSHDCTELGLTFSLSEDTFGKTMVIPFVANGENMPVTNENKVEYIIHYANYVMNRKFEA